MPIDTVVTSFLLGLGSAASPCLLPLYPGFLAYLAGNRGEPGHTRSPALLGLTIVAGVISAVTVAALVVAGLAIPFTGVLSILVPATTVVLVGLGLVMLAGRNPFATLATVRVPVIRSPVGQAYAYGLLLGPVAVPCAGPFLVALLAISVGLADAGARIGSFIVFGIGFCLPLIALAMVGAARGQAVARAVARRHGVVVRVAGALLIVAAFAEPIRLAFAASTGG